MSATADLLVIGAGPAGLTAALAFKRHQPASRVILLDRMPVPGVKLAVTGGGRGNLSRDLPPEALAAAFGHAARFVAPAFRAFPVAALREFLRGIGVPTQIETGGGIYPVSQSAASVRDAFAGAVRHAGVEFHLNAAVTRLDPPGESGLWHIHISSAPVPLTACRVLLAAGGQSAPSLGSDGSGFTLARKLGHTIVPPVPALAPLHTQDTWPARLSGISIHEATLSLPAVPTTDLPAAKTFGDLLFTHKGLSGPAALNISAAVARRLAAGIRPAPLRLSVLTSPPDFQSLRQAHGARPVLAALSRLLPRALADELLSLAGIPPDTPCARLSSLQTHTLSTTLIALPVPIASTGTFVESMATSGGVTLSEVAPRTLASRIHSTLSFAGEILDVAGPTGGYNLHWAFASGHLAASRVA